MRLIRSLLHHRSIMKSPVSGVAFMIFFFSLFNGTVGYVVPLAMERQGFPSWELGLLYSTSSVAGALFDLVMCRVMRTTHYRCMFIVMFIVATAFPIVLWRASHPLVFILAMSLWGLYYNFFKYARFDFVGRLPHREHAPAWGTMNAAQSAGLVIAPMVAGMLFHHAFEAVSFLASMIFLVIAVAVFVLMVFRQKNNLGEQLFDEISIETRPATSSGAREWWQVGKKLYPVLALSFFINVLDSFFWVIGPLFALTFHELRMFDGLFLSMYFLPALFVGTFIKSGSRRFGKKRLSFMTCSAGSLFLAAFGLVVNSWSLLLLTFVASAFFSVSWPALNGAYADYIEETPKLEKSIEAMEDFVSNIGYVVGPIVAGIFAHVWGDQNAFVGIGVIGVMVGIILLKITPRRIRLAAAHG